MPQTIFDYKPILIQVMAWCHQQAISWASVKPDLCRHMASLGHDMLKQVWTERPGPRLNIKTVLSTYGDFHVKGKTAVRTSYL